MRHAVAATPCQRCRPVPHLSLLPSCERIYPRREHHGIGSTCKPLQAHRFGRQGGAGHGRRQRHRLGDSQAARWGCSSLYAARGGLGAPHQGQLCRQRPLRAPNVLQPLLLPGLHGAKVVISGRREQVHRLGCGGPLAAAARPSQHRLLPGRLELGFA